MIAAQFTIAPNRIAHRQAVTLRKTNRRGGKGGRPRNTNLCHASFRRVQCVFARPVNIKKLLRLSSTHVYGMASFFYLYYKYLFYEQD